MTKISVVITTYKRPMQLLEAIQSVLRQTYQAFEIIVVDGGNTFKNEVVSKGFDDKRIKYVKVEPEAVNYISYKGIQHSRNVGCKKAKGEYIAMLDDDDRWEKDKLEKQVNCLTDDLSLVTTYCKTINPEGETIEKAKTNPSYEDLLKSFNVTPTSTFLIRRSDLEKVGWWNEDLRGMHEYDIALKFAKNKYKMMTIPEPLMVKSPDENQNRGYYYIKIAEVVDLWKFYGKDFIPCIGIKGLLTNIVRTLGLFGIYLMGYVFKGKIWSVLFPLKSFYDKSGVTN